MSDFKDTWTGAGTMDEFVKEANILFKAMNNINVTMPPYYTGPEPTLRIEGDQLVFDMSAVSIFTLNNIKWLLFDDGTAVNTSNSALIKDGNLVIIFTAESV